jgi:hypothetical protein
MVCAETGEKELMDMFIGDDICVGGAVYDALSEALI